MRYLTGASNPGVRAVAQREHIGLMVQPGNGYGHQVLEWPYWAADNACFRQGPSFKAAGYLAWLASLPRSGCLFAVAPDVVGDAAATLRRSLPVLPQIRALGFRPAYVLQPGFRVAEVPWEAFDVLFLGGGVAYRATPAVVDVIAAAHRQRKPVHMGRVNSLARLRHARGIGCDSADGTFLAFGPTVNLARLVGWQRWLRQNPELPLGEVCG